MGTVKGCITMVRSQVPRALVENQKVKRPQVDEKLNKDESFYEEVVDDYDQQLPGVSILAEDHAESSTEEEEIEEVEISDCSGHSELFSVVEEEEETDYEETEIEEVVDDEGNSFAKLSSSHTRSDHSEETIVEYVDDSVAEDATEASIDEITIAEDELHNELELSCAISEASEDSASAEELAEAIEYVLRQEKAVAKFILTEDQAKSMTSLPLKVMRIIVDHFENADNQSIDIDWDFLLKIVLPYTDDDPGDDSETELLICRPVTRRN